jgi:Septum formation
VVIGAVVVVGALFVLGGGDGGGGGRSGPTSATKLVAGDCFEGSTGDAKVDVVGCDERHDGEVFAVVDFERGRVGFPGAVALEDFASDGCGDRFDTYVGASTDPADLDVVPLIPTADQWNAGEREVTCRAVDAGGGTLEGSIAD